MGNGLFDGAKLRPVASAPAIPSRGSDQAQFSAGLTWRLRFTCTACPALRFGWPTLMQMAAAGLTGRAIGNVCGAPGRVRGPQTARSSGKTPVQPSTGKPKRQHRAEGNGCGMRCAAKHRHADQPADRSNQHDHRQRLPAKPGRCRCRCRCEQFCVAQSQALHPGPAQVDLADQAKVQKTGRSADKTGGACRLGDEDRKTVADDDQRQGVTPTALSTGLCPNP